jgi:hypothetical protein
LTGASTSPSREQLLIEVSQDIMSMVNQKQNPLAGFKPDSSAIAGTLVLDELSAVNDILRAKANPDEADAFRRWLLDVAQGAADAAKEGGFMGFGAVRVSEGEQAMLERLGSTLGVS